MTTVEGPVNSHQKQPFEKAVAVGSLEMKARNMTFHERTSSGFA
jgi:hypothetical protein